VEYLTVKWIHILSSTLLFGTGLGSAFYMYFACRTRDARVIDKSHWITLDALEQHWTKARVDARIVGDGIQATTTNISALTFEMRPGLAPFSATPKILIDGQILTGSHLSSDRSWRTHLSKTGGQWSVANSKDVPHLSKKPGLQGPIDDAFMDSFIFVIPTSLAADAGSNGENLRSKINQWVKQESEHAIKEWRRHFRGEPRVVKDTELTPEQITSANLVLWGTPSVNTYLRKIADRLPIRWQGDQVQLANQSFSADSHVPAFIYPNPENPNRYIVLNSGFTFREYDYLNNARQIAKLPDYAIIDTSVPPNSRYPGKVVTAGFFNEHWHLQ
jgi:hypothetical protein